MTDVKFLRTIATWSDVDSAIRNAAEEAADEIERLNDNLAKERAKVQWFVNKAADEKLDGYRELAARAAEAENDRDALQRALDIAMDRHDQELTTLEHSTLRPKLDAALAENKKFRAALEQGRIATEPFDDVKPRRWETDYSKLADFHKLARDTLMNALMNDEHEGM